MVDSVEPNIFVEKIFISAKSTFGHIWLYQARDTGLKKNEFANENIIKIKKPASEEDTFECSNTNSYRFI